MCINCNSLDRIKNADVLIMGITFKENCPDVRNTRVIDTYHELKEFELNVDIYDPWADALEVKSEYGIDIINATYDTIVYDAIVLAVAHDEFINFDFQKVKRNNGVIFDAKACLDRGVVDGRL